MTFPNGLRLAAAAAFAVFVAACGSSATLEPTGTTAPDAGAPPPVAEGVGKRCESGADADTAERIGRLRAGEVGEFVVTFDGTGPLGADQIEVLRSLDIAGVRFGRLPMAGVLATRAQAEALMRAPGVRSVRFNDPVTLDNEDARYLSSVDQAQAAPELVNAQGQPFTGKGVAILVNDSGIDAGHMDLLYGVKVIENATGYFNLRQLVGTASSDEGYDYSVPFTPVEGVVNSDVGGSHGTHVAGIAAGDGTLSGGHYAGAASGASLIGYGSGLVLLVLDTLGGFDYALQILDEHPEYNLRVVTNSFGNTGDVGTCFDPDDPTNVATKMLADRGVIVVFSAGNSGSGPDTMTGNFKKAPWVLAAANGEKSGLLAESSSRGSLAHPAYEVEVDGETFIVEDRPTVVTAGTDIISTRAVAADPFTPLDLSDDFDRGDIPAELLPFYTQKSGTSMAAPHLAGLVALLLEANPALTWREVKSIFKQTATNLPGYAPWEVGAGFANVEAALAMALSLREDYGLTQHLSRGFHAEIPIDAPIVENVEIDFVPVGETGSHTFEVGEDIALVIAQWSQPLGDPCTCAIVLLDPDGNRYGSSIALPVLGANVAASAPGRPGTWTLTVRGIGSVSGVALDPLGIGNGTAGPSTLDIRLSQFKAGVPRGLGDVAGRADQGVIEFAVGKRLMDGRAGGFAPDAALTRGELAEYLMSFGVRQTRPHRSSQQFADTGGLVAAAADAVTRTGALILDRSPESLPPMAPAVDGGFAPAGSVSREQLAFALVQTVGHQARTASYEGMDLFAVDAQGDAVPVVDAADVTPALRNHVQDALVMRLLDVEFTGEGEARVARLHPRTAVARAEYARAVTQAYAGLGSAE